MQPIGQPGAHASVGSLSPSPGDPRPSPGGPGPLGTSSEGGGGTEPFLRLSRGQDTPGAATSLIEPKVGDSQATCTVGTSSLLSLIPPGS